MRAYDIALIIAMFTAVSGVINDIGFMNEYELPVEPIEYSDEDFSQISGEIISKDDSLLKEDMAIGTTSVFAAIGKLDDYIFIKSTIMKVFATNLEYQSVEWHKINNIANLIQVGCGFVYMFAILQLWRKVSTKHME